VALRARYLADKSALVRLGRPTVGERLAPLIDGGLVATCSVVLLEVLFSARSPLDHRRTRERMSLSFELATMDQAALDRAVEVQAALAERGRHRGVSLPDLMIAATAETHGLIVLHYDADFDRIAAVTGQATEWVVTRGSVA
jgi:predicted nucleic acid-binding protein